MPIPGLRGVPFRWRLLTITVLLFATLLALTATQARAAGTLVAAYSFDDGSGATLTDASGNGKNGTIVGASWTTGKFGSALDFNGTSSRVDLPALGTFYKSGFTLEAWVKKNGSKLDDGIVGTWNWPEGGPMLWIDHLAGHHFLTLGTSMSNYLDSAAPFTADEWKHVAATYDGATARFYINGIEVASTPFTGNVGDSNTWRIGAYGVSPANYFDGLIDEVRIYDR